MVQFSNDEEEEEEYEGTFKTRYEEIQNKIKKRMTKKRKREENIKSIDWQKMRLPELARTINQKCLL
jgi:hypothetical protein